MSRLERRRELKRATDADRLTRKKWKKVKRLAGGDLVEAWLFVCSSYSCGHCQQYQHPGCMGIGSCKEPPVCPLVVSGKECINWPMWVYACKNYRTKKLLLRLADLVIKRSAAAVANAKGALDD